MKTAKRGLVLLGVLRWLVGSPALAQPHPTAQFKQDQTQCQQAQATLQCRDALPACQRAYDILAALPHEPKRQLAQAKLLNDWAGCEDQLGHYAQAESHLRSALAMRQKLLGGEHPDVAESQNNLAQVLASQGKYGEAETLLRRSLALGQKLLGKEDLDVAKSRNNLALLLESQGKYGEAAVLARMNLALRQKLLGDEHPDVAESQNNLALVLESQGQFREAEALFRKSLLLSQKLRGTEHPIVGVSLENLAHLLLAIGRHGEAETLYRKSLGLRQKVLGEEHPGIAISQNNLASVLAAEGKYREAETLYRKSLAVWQKALGEEHPNIAVSQNNLAVTLKSVGKYDEAETLYRRSLVLLLKNLGEEHPHVAGSKKNLALVLRSQGKYGEAEALLRQSLALRQKLLGAEHPDVAISQNDLALIWESQGKYGEAEALYRKSLAVRQKLLGADHPDVAQSQQNLAHVLSTQGRYVEAEALYRKSLALWQKALGEDHPDVALGQSSLAFVLLATGSPTSALPHFRQVAQIRDKQLRTTISETRMQALVDGIRHEEDAIYGLLLQPNLDGSAELSLSTALLRKGRVAEAGAMANRVVQGQLDRPQVAKQFAEWQGVRQQREALLYGELGTMKPAAYRQRLEDLKQQAESLEHILVADLPELGRLQPPAMDQIVSQVVARLPQDGVLVEVVWTRPYLAKRTGPAQCWGEPHYIAILLFPDRHIVPVDLGEAAAMDPQVRELLSALSSPGADALKAAQAIYARVMKPLLGQLAGRRNIYLSLDGTLSLIPFDALHDGTDYLLGRYRFHYLSSGRDLLRDLAQRPASAAVVLGNPDFGKAEEKSTAAGSASLYQRLSGLSQLPGTQREVEAIAERLHIDAKTQKQAREDVVRAVHAPRILHIATHGLFLRDVELPASAGLDRGLRRASAFDPPRSNIILVPVAESLPGELGVMNRSALVLADAARGAGAQDTARDGLLTADEARSLDLYGTQLVVLSACETGQGALSAGQGIYGLRRAFLVAGAETLVTSLWRVSDDATGELMTQYYEKLLDKQKPGDRLGAMVEAMQEMRKQPGREHPYYWAAFLVIGQDGPLH